MEGSVEGGARSPPVPLRRNEVPSHAKRKRMEINFPAPTPAAGGLFGAGPLTPVGDRLFGVVEEELPLNTSGLAVLIVVYQGTRLCFALSHQTKLGYVRSVVSRYVGQDVSLWQPRLGHVISQRLPDEAIVGVLQRAPSIVAVAAGTEMPSSHPDSHPDKANPSEIATANAVTAEREREKLLFVPAVRRAVYTCFINPRRPGAPNVSPTAEAVAAASQARIPFEVMLYADRPLSKFVLLQADAACRFAFVTNGLDAPAGFVAVGDAIVLDALKMLGDPSGTGVALVAAFETWLTLTAQGWTTADTELLPVEFLVAFGRELTQRLDCSHRIRSTKLDEESLRTLRTPPFDAYVDQPMLTSFQG